MIISLFNDCLCFAVRGYFPASGLRYCQRGYLSQVAIEGSEWSSSPLALGQCFSSARYFLSSSIQSLFQGYRGHSRPVRCVQELAGILYHFDSFFEDVIRMV